MGEVVVEVGPHEEEAEEAAEVAEVMIIIISKNV